MTVREVVDPLVTFREPFTLSFGVDQYYSVICRPSDHTVGRPQAKIRIRARRPRGRDTSPTPFFGSWIRIRIIIDADP